MTVVAVPVQWMLPYMALIIVAFYTVFESTNFADAELKVKHGRPGSIDISVASK